MIALVSSRAKATCRLPHSRCLEDLFCSSTRSCIWKASYFRPLLRCRSTGGPAAAENIVAAVTAQSVRKSRRRCRGESQNGAERQQKKELAISLTYFLRKSKPPNVSFLEDVPLEHASSCSITSPCRSLCPPFSIDHHVASYPKPLERCEESPWWRKIRVACTLRVHRMAAWWYR